MKTPSIDMDQLFIDMFYHFTTAASERGNLLTIGETSSRQSKTPFLSTVQLGGWVCCTVSRHIWIKWVGWFPMSAPVTRNQRRSSPSANDPISAWYSAVGVQGLSRVSARRFFLSPALLHCSYSTFDWKFIFIQWTTHICAMLGRLCCHHEKDGVI